MTHSSYENEILPKHLVLDILGKNCCYRIDWDEGNAETLMGHMSAPGGLSVEEGHTHGTIQTSAEVDHLLIQQSPFWKLIL